MAQLIVLNGLPGSGKSTLARRYVDEHPLALCLDIDVVRGLLGRWRDDPDAAGQLALAMARVALGEGGDVIVPQFVGRPGLLEHLEALAAEQAARFVEVALVEDLEQATARLARRGTDPTTQAQREAHAELERCGGPAAALPEMHARLHQVLVRRPATITLAPTDGQIDQTYRELLTLIDAVPPTPDADPRPVDGSANPYPLAAQPDPRDNSSGGGCEMPWAEVSVVLDALDAAGCRWWLEGGWGVDALVGTPTCIHRDLDIDLHAADEPAALAVLADLGYQIEVDWRPNRVELVAPDRGRVDLHPLQVDPLSRATVHAMWRSDGPEDPVGWLAGYGWDAEVFHPAERAHAYGRGPAPSEPLDPPRRLLVTAYKSSGQPAGGISGNPRSRK